MSYYLRLPCVVAAGDTATITTRVLDGALIIQTYERPVVVSGAGEDQLRDLLNRRHSIRAASRKAAPVCDGSSFLRAGQ